MGRKVYGMHGRDHAPGGSDPIPSAVEFVHFREAGGTNPQFQTANGWEAVPNWGSFNYGNATGASIVTTTGAVTLPGPARWYVEVWLRLDPVELPDPVGNGFGAATLHLEGPVGRDLYSSVVFIDRAGSWAPPYAAIVEISAVFEFSGSTATITPELSNTVYAMDAGNNPVDPLELVAQSFIAIKLA